MPHFQFLTTGNVPGRHQRRSPVSVSRKNAMASREPVENSLPCSFRYPAVAEARSRASSDIPTPAHGLSGFRLSWRDTTARRTAGNVKSACETHLPDASQGSSHATLGPFAIRSWVRLANLVLHL